MVGWVVYAIRNSDTATDLRIQLTVTVRLKHSNLALIGYLLYY